MKRQLLELLRQKRPSNNLRTVMFFEKWLFKNINAKHKIYRDDSNNFTVIIGNQPKTAFAAHYDTVHAVFEDNIVETTGGHIRAVSSQLGADDAAGIYIMIRMIGCNRPGLYVFFADEEVGGIGSSRYVLPHDIDLMVSFDRLGTKDVVIEQSAGRCASEECGQWLADAINEHGFEYCISYEGSFTDSSNFRGVIPECINLSVGYYKQHTYQEYLDYGFLVVLSNALCKIDFNKAVISREPGADEFNYNDVLASYVYENPEATIKYLAYLGVTADEIDLWNF